MNADAGEITYFVLLDRAAPYLLARVRWPDVAQAITAGNPDWLDDVGLFDLPYDPSVVTVSFTQAASVAASWGRQLHAEPARDVPSFIRRMPANWSDLTPVERQALGLDATRRRRVSARSLRRLRSTRAKIAAAAHAGGYPDAFAAGSSAVSLAAPANHGGGRNQAAGLPMAGLPAGRTAADETTLVNMPPASAALDDVTLVDMPAASAALDDVTLVDMPPASTKMDNPTRIDMRPASAALDDVTRIDMIRADKTTGLVSGAIERRGHVRLPVDGRAHIRWGKTTISAGLVDLSEGGARCVLPEAPPLLARGATLGGPFLLEAEVATSRICLDVAARIAWHRSIRAGVYFGVVFGELDLGETDGMQGFLAAAAAGRRGAR